MRHARFIARLTALKAALAPQKDNYTNTPTTPQPSLFIISAYYIGF
jgi:hypothetical protein